MLLSFRVCTSYPRLAQRGRARNPTDACFRRLGVKETPSLTTKFTRKCYLYRSTRQPHETMPVSPLLLFLSGSSPTATSQTMISLTSRRVSTTLGAAASSKCTFFVSNMDEKIANTLSYRFCVARNANPSCQASNTCEPVHERVTENSNIK